MELALAAARQARDWGNAILVIGIVAEIVIEAVWPDAPDLFPLLRGKHATKPLTRWRDHFWKKKNLAILIVGLVTVFGLGLERVKGQAADDLADQIRTDLEERQLRVSPRIWLFRGEALERVSAKMKPFAGQRVAVFANQKFVDDRQEVLFFAISLDAVLGGAGWLGPSGETVGPGPTGLLTNMSLDPPNRDSIEMILIETSPTSSSKTKLAADMLADALNSERVSAYVHNDSKPMGLNIPNDADVIAITVGRRLLP